MTIKETIEQIKNNLDTSYLKLQELKYEEGFETFVRLQLLDIITIIERLQESIYSQKSKQNTIKRQGKKG